MRLLRFALLTAIVSVFSVSVHAAPVDPITVTYVGASESSITFEIQAGPSGTPGGIWLDWMDRAEFDANGWAGYTVYCVFNGTPTYNTVGTGTSYMLGPNENIQVEIGDVFDETGMWANYTGELEDGTEYVVRAYPMAGGGYTAGTYTPNAFASTVASPGLDCIHTQGYWKNHTGDWNVTDMFLGNVNYTAAELLDIFNTPAAGNGLIFLAHQLIAAKLNLAEGASPTAQTLQDIADADALIGNLVVPPVGAGYLDPAVASPLNNALDSFNNGSTAATCDPPVPTEESTWGRLKALYSDK